MENILDVNVEAQGFKELFNSEHAVVFTRKPAKEVLCVLQADYVPIKEFRKIFQNIGEELKRGNYHTLIFDKRALTTFHQPSMEWYYIEWKTEMLDHGLNTYKKILPELNWFRKAVEVARETIQHKLDKEVSQKMDIRYYENLDEALKK